MKYIIDIIDKAYEKGIYQNKEEIINLVYFLKDKNIKNVLEIGTAEGGTFYIWCKITDKKRIKISVDERNKKILSMTDNIHIIKGDSHDENTFLEVKKILGYEKLDLLFLDGDHSYEDVKQDYNMYKYIVREGGYIIFNNISDTKCGVSKFWKQFKCNKIEFCEGNLFRGIGVIERNLFSEYHVDNLVFNNINFTLKNNGIMLNTEIEDILSGKKIKFNLYLINFYKTCNNRYLHKIFRRRVDSGWDIDNLDMMHIDCLDGLLDMAHCYLSKDSVVAEIGSFRGSSTEVFAFICKKVYAIDLWNTSKYTVPTATNVEKDFNNLVFKYNNIIKCKGSSFEKHKDFKDYMFDAVYIDGDHSYESVKKDILNWLPKIKKDGIICGHDFSLESVAYALRDVFSSCRIRTYRDSSWVVDLREYYSSLR